MRILDAAVVPSGAISPDVPRAVGLGSLVGLALALSLAFLLEMLDSTVKTQDDVEKVLGVPLLGIIPTIKPENEAAETPPALAPALASARVKARDLYILTKPKSAVAECCRSIRTNILFMTPDKPAKTLLITSASPQEGKTTTSVNIAISMAMSGLKVLLVDSDMRRPRLHKVFGLPQTQDGLSRAIVGEAEVLDMVRETGVPGLKLLPCGALPPNPRTNPRTNCVSKPEYSRNRPAPFNSARYRTSVWTKA